VHAFHVTAKCIHEVNLRIVGRFQLVVTVGAGVWQFLSRGQSLRIGAVANLVLPVTGGAGWSQRLIGDLTMSRLVEYVGYIIVASSAFNSGQLFVVRIIVKAGKIGVTFHAIYTGVNTRINSSFRKEHRNRFAFPVDAFKIGVGVAGKARFVVVLGLSDNNHARKYEHSPGSQVLHNYSPWDCLCQWQSAQAD
jgi:hypothetical protein